jgi:hypothetical protein
LLVLQHIPHIDKDRRGVSDCADGSVTHENSARDLDRDWSSGASGDAASACAQSACRQYTSNLDQLNRSSFCANCLSERNFLESESGCAKNPCYMLGGDSHLLRRVHDACRPRIRNSLASVCHFGRRTVNHLHLDHAQKANIQEHAGGIGESPTTCASQGSTIKRRPALTRTSSETMTRRSGGTSSPIPS